MSDHVQVMNDIQKLLIVFDAYVALTGQAPSTVSTRFMQRGARIGDLRAGGDMGSRTIQKIIKTFSEQWPVGAPWPDGVERPSAGGVD
jgi:hypothetical protein